MAQAPKFPVVKVGPALLMRSYFEKPDTTAPAGAKFKPDGKYKGTLVLPGDYDFTTIEAEARAIAKADLSTHSDEDLRLPWKAGEPFNDKDGNENVEFVDKFLLQAKSDRSPETVDGRGKRVPNGVFAKYGDKVIFKIALVPYEKDEQVREGKKTVTVKAFGVSARLYGVQIVERGQGGSDGGWDEAEGGWSAEGETPRQGGQTGREAGAAGGGAQSSTDGDY